jgi:hypothetical protein
MNMNTLKYEVWIDKRLSISTLTFDGIIDRFRLESDTLHYVFITY